MTTIRTLSLGLAIVAAGSGLARAQQRSGQELRTMFAKLDANNDKVVERSEVPARAMPAFEKLLKLADTNKDGKLEASEMRDLIKGMGPDADAPAAGNAPAGDPMARFKAIDKDGDGKVSKAEFPGQPAMFDRLDANKDGFLDKDEARALGAGGGAGGGMLGAPVMAMDKDGDGKVSRAEFTGQPAVFDALDTDNDGKLDKAEAAKAPEVRARLIQGMDADGDRKISRDEWKGQPAAFDRLDANKDGFVSFDELRDAAQSATPKADTPAKKAAAKKKA